ncbi:hypothetical protein FFI94_022080 [Rhodococcus sp. KBS0724]|uniref:hypothetical protein n=1 Tax=Rhodococcus sp. KBS0724 TaxID=1179674 RepID=UPI00110EB4C8|nr:hypothetical protein [Rhodococcus sp. KBS0724]TSD48555.1 hypothetical protein FFI94_022080 [Rhodococcus sp. KBS0724]
MPRTRISDDIITLPSPQLDAAAELIDEQRKALSRDKGRHRIQTAGMSRRVLGTLSAAVLAGCGIAYFATDHGLIQ